VLPPSMEAAKQTARRTGTRLLHFHVYIAWRCEPSSWEVNVLALIALSLCAGLRSAIRMCMCQAPQTYIRLLVPSATSNTACFCVQELKSVDRFRLVGTCIEMQLRESAVLRRCTGSQL